MNYERFIAPDGLPDDRMTCRSCTLLDQRGRCTFFETRIMPDLPRRCVHFMPIKSLTDQRTGAQRWPGIVEQIQEISRIDQEFMERRR